MGGRGAGVAIGHLRGWPFPCRLGVREAMDAKDRGLHGDVYELVWSLGDRVCHELVLVEDTERAADVLGEADSLPFVGFVDVEGRSFYIRADLIAALIPACREEVVPC